MAIWSNQFRTGQIPLSDMVNAAEFITGVTSLQSAGQTISWGEFFQDIEQSSNPHFAILPTTGNFSGLHQTEIEAFDLTKGLVIFGGNLVLGFSKTDDKNVAFSKLDRQLPSPDPRAIRAALLDQVNYAEKLIASYQMGAARDEVEQTLNLLKVLHLPPALPTKTRNDLELSAKIIVIAQMGIDRTVVMDSPSNDSQKSAELKLLVNYATQLMAACTVVT